MRTLVVAALMAAPAAADGVPEALARSYDCAGGQRLQVAYLNPPGGPSLAVVAWDGRLVPMRAGPTGSGVRYVAFDASGLLWHVKGAAGFLAHDAGGSETVLVDDCRERAE